MYFPQSQSQSDIARIRAQVEAEYQALYHLQQFRHIGGHDYVDARYKALDGTFERLEREYGTDTALNIICDTYVQVMDQKEEATL